MEREEESRKLKQQKITEEVEKKRLAAEYEQRNKQGSFGKLRRINYRNWLKTMDYLERAKREEAAPLIEAAFQQRLVEEKALHEHEQQQEIELSRQRHDGDLKEKNRLSRILENKIIF
ncbi:hypothetical protein OIU76_028724 [Salix suchowensis]|nr:hypothetical protein OIU76_028724 [Salix suchowensis]